MGPFGNRPELFEPGARIICQDKDKSRFIGEVEGQTANYVILVDGQTKVRKDRVLGPARRPVGFKTYRVVLNVGGFHRHALQVHALDPQGARDEAERVAHKVTGQAWEAGTVTLLGQVMA